MAFNIMDLFAAPARNMLLQPQQSAQGVQNMLLTRQPPQDYPVAAAPAVPQVDPQTVAAVQGPSAQIAAPAGPQMAQAAPQGQPFFNDDRKAYLNDLFTGWAAGSTPSESLAYGAKLVAANSQNRKGRNDTIDWLKSKGVDEATAKQLASSPPALNEYLKNMYEAAKPIEIGGRLVDPKTYQVIADFSDPNAGMTADQKEYLASQKDPKFMDYQIKMKEAGRQQVNIDTGVKLPSGYQWVDPNDQSKGVRPIAGGPATQIPGELAARVGMSESFQGDAPGLRDRLQSGDMTGPIDTTLAQWGIGDRGQTYRQIQSGVDALTRLLTGAGMNIAEAKAYSERYLPGYRDTPESAVQKLDQLSKELESAKSMAMRGRGGDIGGGQNAGDIDALLKKYGAQ